MRRRRSIKRHGLMIANSKSKSEESQGKEQVMVFSSTVVVTVARVSGEAWQLAACIDQPLSGEQLFDLLCCLPLQPLGRLALCLCSFFCLPHPNSIYSSYLLPSDDDDDDDDDNSFDYGAYYVVDDDDDDNHGGGGGSSSASLDFDDFYYHSHSD